MNQYTKGPEAPPMGPKATGYTTSGTYIQDPAKVEAWRLRWELEYRHTRWVERDGKFYPRQP